MSLAAHNSLCTGHILQFGNKAQKIKWLPKLASAEHIGAWGLTEHNTGSDAGGMSTTAVKDGNEWVINGAKNFITHAISGDVAVVIVRTGEKGDSHGMSAFVVEKEHPDFLLVRKKINLECVLQKQQNWYLIIAEFQKKTCWERLVMDLFKR